MATSRTLPPLLLAALLGLLCAAEAWGGDEPGDAAPQQDQDEQGEVRASSMQDAELSLEVRRRLVLEQLPGKPDLLINLDQELLPATSDLIRLGKPATPAILNGLVGSMDSTVRGLCASVLIATRDPRALEPLIDALDDPDEHVVQLALQALGSVESRQATPRLLALVRQQRVPGYLKAEAYSTLGRLGDPSAVRPLLTAFLASWDPAAQQALWSLRRLLSAAELEQVVVRPLQAPANRPAPAGVLAFSVERAGELRLAAAVQPLQRHFATHPALQNRIVYNLGRIGDRGAVPFLRSLLDRTAQARLMNNVCFALQRLGQDVQPFLRTALADRRAYIRFNAAFVAGDLKLVGLAPELAAALQDANDYVRSEVAVALGKLAAPSTVPALQAASQEWNPVVRRDSLLALARIDYPQYRQRVLDELVRSKLPSVRRSAVRFLAERADATVVAPALAALDANHWEEAQLGVTLLDRFAALDDPAATAFLLRLAAGDSVRHEALRLLGRFTDERARFVLRQWMHRPAGEQDQLLRALGRYQDRESLPAARAWLASSDPSAALHAAFFLAALGEAEGGQRLLTALDEAPAEGKATAARLLSELDLARVPQLEPGLVARLDHADVYVRLYAARTLADRGDARGWQRLATELAKKVPFVDEEVLGIARQAPRQIARPVLEQWRRTADPRLAAELARLLAAEQG